jgi:hypothetical protein
MPARGGYSPALLLSTGADSPVGRHDMRRDVCTCELLYVVRLRHLRPVLIEHRSAERVDLALICRLGTGTLEPELEATYPREQGCNSVRRWFWRGHPPDPVSSRRRT